MLLTLVMVVRNEEQILDRCLDENLRRLITSWTVVDTGSTDDTQDKVRNLLAEIPGEIFQRPWVSFAHNRTDALALAPTDGWLLMLDADMTVDHHPDLAAWLATDPDPDTDIWQIEITENGTRWRLPLLLRAGPDWAYRGATHEWLDAQGRKQRPLLGLTITHHADGSSRNGKFERDLELLQPGVEAGDPRDTFYAAESLRFLGRTDEAIAMYRRRAWMGGFDEEAWYAAYQAATLADNVDQLLDAYQRRPWRHEPLQAAARIVARREHDDVLFLEPAVSQADRMVAS